jgi:hypothetical protein
MRAALIAVALLLAADTANAEFLHAPIGGRAVPLGGGRVACESPAGDWEAEPGSRLVRPPHQEAAIGRAVELKVAASSTACAESETRITLIAVDRYPAIDPVSLVFSPDEGRLDAAGSRLLGVAFGWKSGANQGFDVCHDVWTNEGIEHCSWGVARNASADLNVTTFSWLPRGGRSDPQSTFYDGAGRMMPPESFVLRPSRVLLSRLVPADAAVDLATGQGEVPLVHPEAVGSADCGQLTCEMVEGRLIVRGASSLVSNIDIRLRLVPHVFFMRKEQPEAQVTVKLPVMHCPMSIVSGAPVRNNDEAKVIVKLDRRCANDLPSVRFVTRDGSLKVLQTHTERDATFVLLSLGRIGGDTLTISAVRGEAEGIALAVAYTPTRAAPQVRARIELPTQPNLDFIPNNRWASVHVSSAGEHQHFVPLPLEGVYMVQEHPGGPARIRAEPNAAGLVTLRFGLRSNRLPAGLDQIDLAVLEDPLQRGTRESNMPAPLVATKEREPLVEFLCGGGSVPTKHIEVGVTAYLSFDLRDTCRVVFHRDRLQPDDGTQKIHFEVDVLRPDGMIRPEGHIAEVVIVRAGADPRYAWIRGITDPFDRVRVRVSHVADDDHYIGASELKTGAPAAQWTAVMGVGKFRLYGTSTIPAGLYRFGFGDGGSQSSGVLQLNFGVISRLVSLDKEGHEFPLAIETGVLVFGITNSRSMTGEQLFQVGVVAGLGFAVPIANRSMPSQASVNLHAWFEYNVMREAEGSRYALIFGPSISIGNVGTSL